MREWADPKEKREMKEMEDQTVEMFKQMLQKC